MAVYELSRTAMAGAKMETIFSASERGKQR